jgi:type II secretory pathway pseudopilin PulG
MDKKGFSLIEMLIYIGVLAVMVGVFFRILTISTRVQVEELSANEVSQQMNFVMQTIQRLVRTSSYVEEAGLDNGDTGEVEYAYLKLRMPNPDEDPTCISLIDIDGAGAIVIEQGSEGFDAEGEPDGVCKNREDENRITTEKVTITTTGGLPGLAFQLLSGNYPGKDIVQIDLTMEFNTENPLAKVSRSLTSAIGRVNAATFDSPLTPGASIFDIGSLTNRWNKLWVTDADVAGTLDVSGILDVDGTIFQDTNFNGGTRGLMVVAISTADTCNSVCALHTGQCAAAFNVVSIGGSLDPPIANTYALQTSACGNNPSGIGGYCYCY